MPHEISLKAAKTKLAEKELHFRAADFLSDEEQQKLHEINEERRKPARPYDDIDAFAAEILARFGWHTYTAWQSGEIDSEKIARYIAAERARDAAKILPLEAMTLLATMGANNTIKGKAPESLRRAQSLLKEQIKKAKGE